MITKSTMPDAAYQRLVDRLTAPESARFFGRSFALKCEVLANLEAGNRSLADIGREYHVTRQAVAKVAQQARAAYGLTTTV
jgi:hypothetical protein